MGYVYNTTYKMKIEFCLPLQESAGIVMDVMAGFAGVAASAILDDNLPGPYPQSIQLLTLAFDHRKNCT